MYRLLVIVGICLIVIFSYKLLFGQDGLIKIARLGEVVSRQEQEVDSLTKRNQAAMIRLEHLKSSPLVLEEQARYELGLVREGEKYYRVVEPIE